MLRRTYLRTAANLFALLFASDRFDLEPRLPADGNVTFWFHFRQAVEHGTLSTSAARETVVEDMTFDRCTREDAVRALELAHKGYFGIDDVPGEWREYWNRVERDQQEMA